MKITDVKILCNRKPIPLPEAWRPAWAEPDTRLVKTTGFSFLEVNTDEGISGIGPSTPIMAHVIDSVRQALVGLDPFYVEKFFEANMGGREDAPARSIAPSLGGVDTALWDIIGKAVSKPVYKILGAYRDRVQVYVATCQLHSAEEHASEAVRLRDEGIRAIKLRLHRPDYRDDLEVVKTVKDSVGDDMQILVDGNQNNYSPSYNHWSRRTAMLVARRLEALNIFYLEDPLPLGDVEGLKQIASAVDMYISGGEHARDVNHFRDLLFRGALDIAEPDVNMGKPGVGMTGSKKVAQIANSIGKLVVPHVAIGGGQGIHLAATLQVAGTVSNCPFVEYPLEPPALTFDTQQSLLMKPILIDKDGCVQVPQLPGIGVEINQDFLQKYM